MISRVAASLALLVSASAALAAEPDARMDRYFSIWADNARITPQTVASLYAERVVYYGKAMTNAQVYRDKASFIRRWPNRRYGVVPGSVSKSCDPTRTTCQITAILDWARTDPRSRAGSRGANSIVLTLRQEGGLLKIARESGSPIAQSTCRSGRRGPGCSAYR